MNVLKATRSKVASLALAGVGLILLLCDLSARPQIAANPSLPGPIPASTTNLGLIRPNGQSPQPAVTPFTNFSSGVKEVLQLVDAGIHQDITKAYIQNSNVAYALTAAEIIALTERGVPGEIVLAMLGRGREWRERAAQNARAATAALVARPPVQAVSPAYLFASPANYTLAPAYSDAPYRTWWYNTYYPAYSYWVWSAPWFYRNNYGCFPYRGYRWQPPYPHRQFVGGRPWSAASANYPRVYHASYSPRSVMARPPGAFRGRPNSVPQRPNAVFHGSPLRGGMGRGR